MRRQLGPDELLAEGAYVAKAPKLTEVMVLNRLIAPGLEHTMVESTKCTAVAEVVGMDLCRLNDEALCRRVDRLDPHRGTIEPRLAPWKDTPAVEPGRQALPLPADIDHG